MNSIMPKDAVKSVTLFSTRKEENNKLKRLMNEKRKRQKENTEIDVEHKLH